MWFLEGPGSGHFPHQPQIRGDRRSSDSRYPSVASATSVSSAFALMLFSPCLRDSVVNIVLRRRFSRQEAPSVVLHK